MTSSSSAAALQRRPKPEEIKEHSYGIVPIALGSPPRLLLIQQKSEAKHWGIPKGHADPGETPLQAAIRELEEETGLKATRFLRSPASASSGKEASGVDAGAIDSEQDSIQGEPYQNPRRNDGWKSNYYFVGLFEQDQTTALRLQEEEVEQAEWLELEAAAERCTFDEARDVVRKAQNWLAAHGIR